mgnify:CR=1 FL=1
METNKILSSKISNILLQQCIVEEHKDIIQSVDKYLIASEQMLRELSLIRINKSTKNDSFSNEIEKCDIYDFEKKYNIDIEQIEAIISSSDESGIREQVNYRKLQHNYYKIMNEILNCKNVVFTETMNLIDNKLSLLEDKSKSIEEKFEGIGSTILSTVVSLTVVVTAITAIEKISAIYIPLYLVSMVWLCMTLIIFINNLFNKKDFNNKQATFLYFVISILVIILLFGTIFYIMNNDVKI